jgi:7-cyano-7-deazaguanine reductase
MEKNTPIFDKVSPALLQIMPYHFVGKNINVCIETDEFTCLCPWTGLPDFAFLTLNYTPAKNIVELKSLKMYLQSYRMAGMVHESVVNSVLDDLVKVVEPVQMNVKIKFNIRGGITTTVFAEYKK